MAHDNGWLEDEISFWDGLFAGANCFYLTKMYLTELGLEIGNRRLYRNRRNEVKVVGCQGQLR